ncbi:TPA: hypothetical protein DCZ46_03975 [Candidatus Campbellbacteria bacterium]|nr:hypothetical protein [Candidatus Campbellbacteria bacterium]
MEVQVLSSAQKPDLKATAFRSLVFVARGEDLNGGGGIQDERSEGLSPSRVQQYLGFRNP